VAYAKHKRSTRWILFFVVCAYIYNAPRATRGMVEMCREDRRMIIPMLIVIPTAIAINGAWLMLWWKSRPSNADRESTQV
jgi:hypothetical protein